MIGHLRQGGGHSDTGASLLRLDDRNAQLNLEQAGVELRAAKANLANSACSWPKRMPGSQRAAPGSSRFPAAMAQLSRKGSGRL